MRFQWPIYTAAGLPSSSLPEVIPFLRQAVLQIIVFRCGSIICYMHAAFLSDVLSQKMVLLSKVSRWTSFIDLA